MTIEYDYRKYTHAMTRKEFLDGAAKEGWEYVEGLPAAVSSNLGMAHDVLFKRSVAKDELDGVYVAVDGHVVGFVPVAFGKDYPTVVNAVLVRAGQRADGAVFKSEPT